MVYLFSNPAALKKCLKRRFIYLFLDYDGTLAPIAEKPENAALPRETKKLISLLSISATCKVALISGRALNDIKKMVGLKEIIYVGNHGFQIDGPKLKFESVISFEFKRTLQEIKRAFADKLDLFEGVLIEDKGYTLSVHYRLSKEKDIPLIKVAFHKVVAPYLAGDKVRLKEGKMVFEIRPPMEWDKGKAVSWLLAREDFALGSERSLPVYLGDDVTDEDAFGALRGKGLTVFVGKPPQRSKARYYLRDTGEVKSFLKMLLELQKV